MENTTVKHVNTEQFDALLLEQDVVFADFWASWCGPCRMIAPFIDQLGEEYAGKATVCKINVDEEPQLAERYQIATIPTVLLFKKGEVKEKSVGAKPKQQFSELIAKYL